MVSGNLGGGILAFDNAVIRGNYIGTDISGDVALGNGGGSGILVSGSNNVTIGTVDVGGGNVISGNTPNGIRVDGGDSVTIQNNIIGLNQDGTTAIGNVGRGVLILGGSTNVRVGTDANGSNDAAEANVISGKQRRGHRCPERFERNRHCGEHHRFERRGGHGSWELAWHSGQ